MLSCPLFINMSDQCHSQTPDKYLYTKEDFQKWEQYSNFTRMWIPTRSLHHSIYFYQIFLGCSLVTNKGCGNNQLSWKEVF